LINANAIKRRLLCRHLVSGALVLPWLLRSAGALAAPAGWVDESEPLAQKLGYRHDASEVDTEAFPKRLGAQGSRQYCDNCALFGGEPGDPDAPCSIFQNRRVAGRGWCNAWVSRS
jgi:hypothetical protein